MTPVSEAVERLRTHGLKTLPGETIQADSAMMDDLRAILTEIARLSEQVRVAMEAMQDADRHLSRPDWTVQRDTVRTKLRETLTRMETADD